MMQIEGRVPVVHIGLPKTATKTLQWRIFAQHSQVFYLGRFDGAPFERRYQQFNACRDETILKIMDEIAYSNFLNPRIRESRELMQRYLAEYNSDHKLPVWSWESYSTDNLRNRQARAESLKNLLGTARIVVTIRNPLKLLESAYLQQLKRDNIGARFRRGKSAFYCSIEDWIKRDHFNDISNHLDYPNTIKMYVEQFGRDNVCVMVFEDLVDDGAKFYKKLCGFMGIDSEEAIELAAHKDDNSRWTEEQLDRLSGIDRSVLKSLQFRFSGRSARKKMLRLDRQGGPMHSAKKASARISSELSEVVLERTRTGNEWLEGEFQLRLRKYGYL